MDRKGSSTTKTKEVVQQEGWLMKRGEGYEEDEEATTVAGQTFDKLLRGKGEKKRYFRLMSIEDQPTSSFVSSSSGRLSNAVSSMTLGKEMRVSHLMNTRVELRYYSKEGSDPSFLKGVITLTSECEVITKTDDANLKLVTPGRSYYLRPEGDPSSATARTISFQWADVIRRQVRNLWVLHQAKARLDGHTSRSGNNSPRSMGVPASPKGGAMLARGESRLTIDEPEQLAATLGELLEDSASRKEFHKFLNNALALENLEFYEAVETLGKAANFTKRADEIMAEFVVAGSAKEVNLSSAQRSTLMAKHKKNFKLEDFHDAKQEVFKLMEDNFFKRFHREQTDKTGAFAALYATLGLDGFNAVLEHFGPAKTDLDRTLIAFKSRLKRADDTLGAIRKELSSSSRVVAVPNEKQTARALAAAYYVTVTRLEALSEFVDEMTNQVVMPLQSLRLKIDADLETIHTSVASNIKELENCRKMIEGAKKDFETAKRNGAGSSDAIQKQINDCENALENLENANSGPIETAMAKLESLELYRIQTQKQIIRYAVIAEQNMTKDIAAAAEAANNEAKIIDPANEMEDLVDALDLQMGGGSTQ